jgi:hypothetical protein
MHRHDQGAQFHGTGILDFINQQDNGSPSLPGRLAQGHKHFGKIDFKIAAVSRATFRFNVKAVVNLSDSYLDRADKTAVGPYII